jgi:hypothetical protein
MEYKTKNYYQQVKGDHNANNVFATFSELL